MELDSIQEAIARSDINEHIKDYVGIVAKELSEIDEMTGSMLKICNGLLAFSFLDDQARNGSLVACCHMLPFGNNHLPLSARMPLLAAETIKKRPLRVVKHFNNLTERDPQSCCFVNLEETLDGVDGKDFSAKKQALERAWDEVKGEPLDDETRNLYDVMYFHSQRVIAFPIHVAGAPIITCYIDDKDDQERRHGQKNIAECLFSRIAPLASQSLFTYLYSRIFNIAEECLKLVEQKSSVEDDLPADRLFGEFLKRVGSLLCAKQLEYGAGDKPDSIAEGSILRRFPAGSRIRIALPETLGSATILLPTFKVGETELCSEGLLSRLQQRQLERLLEGLVNLLHRAALLRQKSRVINALTGYLDELSEVKNIIIKIQRNLEPDQRERNKRWLQEELLSVADGADWSDIGQVEKSRLNELCAGDKKWERYAAQLQTPNILVVEMAEKISEPMANDMHHVFEDMAGAITKMEKESGGHRRNLEALSWSLLSALVTKRAGRENINYEMMVVCWALCYTWLKYPDGSNNRKEWFQLGRLCKTAKASVGNEARLRKLLNIDPGQPLKLQMLSAKRHVVDLDLRCDFLDDANGIPGAAVILLLGSLPLIPSRSQPMMEVCLSSDGGHLASKISFDKRRDDRSRRGDSLQGDTLPITRLSKMMEVIGKFYETDPDYDNLTFKLKVK